MDHVVYLDAKASEMEKLLNGQKNMIIRGAAGRKLPYGRVEKGDQLYFINNNGEGAIKCTGSVASVFNSEKLSKEESLKIIDDNGAALQLTDKQYKRWAGKRYLVLITVENVKEIPEFVIDKSDFGNMDDWLPVGNINEVKK